MPINVVCWLLLVDCWFVLLFVCCLLLLCACWCLLFSAFYCGCRLLLLRVVCQLLFVFGLVPFSVFVVFCLLLFSCVGLLVVYSMFDMCFSLRCVVCCVLCVVCCCLFTIGCSCLLSVCVVRCLLVLVVCCLPCWVVSACPLLDNGCLYIYIHVCVVRRFFVFFLFFVV